MAETILDWLVDQNRIIEKFSYKLIARKRKELCDRCERRMPKPMIRYPGCFLSPITSEGEDCPYFPAEQLAGEEGFEPSLPGPEPGVLPLDYSPATDVTESKSSPLSGLLNTIIPLNLPQKRTGIGKLTQSLLSDPLTGTLGQVSFRIPVKGLFAGNATEVVFLLHSIAPLPEYLEALSAKRLSQPLLKYQPGQLWPTGFLLASHTRASVYHIVTDNANENIPRISIAASAPPNLGGNSFTALSIDETRPRTSRSTLPEYDVEVLL